MALFVQRENRIIAPQWRDYRTSIAAGDLRVSRNLGEGVEINYKVAEKLKRFQGKPNLSSATAVIEACLMDGCLEKAIEAKMFILTSPDAPPGTTDVTKRIFGEDQISEVDYQGEFDLAPLLKEYGRRIKYLRSSLRLSPGNAIKRVQLARRYLLIGKVESAQKEIETGIHLAPDESYIVRCAYQFYHHLQDMDGLERLLRIVRKNPAFLYDPWIFSVELAITKSLERNSKFLKKGFDLVQNQNIHPASLTELASALATEELSHGKSGKAKNLFGQSLIFPNENSLAQAEWASHLIQDLDIGFDKGKSAHEALSHRNLEEGEYEKSFNNARSWLKDQPFSKAAAQHASYVSGSMMDNNSVAINVCKFGLNFHPLDFTLLNNLTYSLAVDGKGEEARQVFDTIEYEKLEPRHQVIWNATEGLLLYASDKSEQGSKSYDKAYQLAIKIKDNRLAAQSMLYKLRAQAFSDCDALSEENIKELQEVMGKFDDPSMRRILDLVAEKVVEVKPTFDGKIGSALLQSKDTYVM